MTLPNKLSNMRIPWILINKREISEHLDILYNIHRHNKIKYNSQDHHTQTTVNFTAIPYLPNFVFFFSYFFKLIFSNL